jgi:hypothetical protein
MAEFIGNLHVQYVDGDSWILVDQDKPDRFGFITDHGEEIYPDNYFVHDFASVPSIFQWLFPKVGRGVNGGYGPAALIHDHLYCNPKIDGEYISRKYADEIFKQGCIASKVSNWITTIMYTELRWWGGIVWRRHKDGRPETLCN